MPSKKELILEARLAAMSKEEVIKYYTKLIGRRDNNIEYLLTRARHAEHQASFLNNQTLKNENNELLREILRLGEGSLQKENAHLMECNQRLSDEINNLNRYCMKCSPK